MMLRTRCLALSLAVWLPALSLIPAGPRAQTPTQPTTTTPIQHVVIIFQENVSFDHYFATYPVAANNNASEPAFTAAPNTPSVNGLTGPLLTNNPNSTAPFRLIRKPLRGVGKQSGTCTFMPTVTDAAGNQSTDTATLILQ